MPWSDDRVSPSVGKKGATPADNKGIVAASDPLDNHHSWINDIKEIIDCCNCLNAEDSFLNIPSNMDEDNPLDMETVKEQQQATDAVLQRRVLRYPDQYTTKRIGMVKDIICHVKPGDEPSNWKIALPQSLLLPTMKWFHQVTGHPGAKWLHLQIGARYYHSNLQGLIDKFRCEHCQHN